ncbi:MAG: Oxidoreductase FAD-binding domain protein [Acidimicrobiales bacterium]|nr:Oxidoreductase FAD-binding domain protein [Acidimicrobiales bacterium]
MAIPAPTARPAGAGRDRGYHPLRVRRIVQETVDACSIVLEVPEDLLDAFAYDAGQFCTFRVSIEGQERLRCYSMSSSPEVDAELQVTVKRVPGGAVSNWLNDALAPGDVIDASPPSGLFRLGDATGDIVAFGGGSGITPIFSIVKSALATTSRRVRLLYANRDQDAVIFSAELAALEARHPDRLLVAHHLDVDRGFVEPGTVRPLIDDAIDADFYVCGPGPFMDVVEGTLLEQGIAPARIHIERFSRADEPAVPEPLPAEASRIEVTIELNGQVGRTEHRPGTTILQTARQLGMAAPFSCESGNCATCMAKLVVGEATMRTNNALAPDEVADGWVLTCQAVPTTPSVRVLYE